MIKYIKSSIGELRNNVSWTKRTEAQKLVVIVVSFSVSFSLIIWGLDTAISAIITQYFKLVN